MNNLFAKELSRILPLYGSARKIAEGMKATSYSTILRAMNGDAMPDVEFVQELISPMPLEHKAAIAIAYCLDHRPTNAPMVKIGLSIDGSDRLDLACSALPDSVRTLLALYVEAIVRDPEAGYKAVEGLAGLVARPEEIVRALSAQVRVDQNQSELSLVADEPSNTPVPPMQPGTDYRKITRQRKD